MAEPGSFEHDRRFASAEVLTPIIVLSGFLGSGKTTTLNKLLADRLFSNTLVIVNEFGEIAIDHLLVEKVSHDLILLEGGCLCCALNGEFVTQLRSLVLRRARREIPDFDRVIVETTGLALPDKLTATVLSDDVLRACFRVDAIVITIAAVNGAQNLLRHEEAVLQVAAADVLVVTKTDLATPAQTQATYKAVAQISTTDAFFEVGLPELPNGLSLAILAGRRGPRQSHLEATPPHGAERDLHISEIRQISFTHSLPIPLAVVSEWLEAMVRLMGEDLLRFKALVQAPEMDGWLLLNAAQGIIHPPALLAKAIERPGPSRLVLIVRWYDPSSAVEALSIALRRHGVGEPGFELRHPT